MNWPQDEDDDDHETSLGPLPVPPRPFPKPNKNKKKNTPGMYSIYLIGLYKDLYWGPAGLVIRLKFKTGLALWDMH